MICKSYRGEFDLSRLGLGCMRFPTEGGDPRAPIDRKLAGEIIDYAYAHGINYYDTAYIYNGGDSEKVLGEVLAKYPRESYYIADKYNVMSGNGYREIFEEQLQRLNTDYIDFYLLHGITDLKVNDYIANGSIEYFREQKALGRIKHLGFSSHANPAALQKMLDQGDWDMVQIQLNFFDWAYGTAADQYKLLKEAGIPVMVMEPIRGGKLMSALSPESVAELNGVMPGASIAQWALRWLMRLDGVQTVLSGMSTLEQIIENVETFSKEQPLDDDQTAALMKAADAYHATLAVPCTGCRYCADGCPMELDIPHLLDTLNHFKVSGPFGLSGLDSIEPGKGPDACIACGTCADRCPQGIAIPDMLAELAKVSKMRF